MHELSTGSLVAVAPGSSAALLNLIRNNCLLLPDEKASERSSCRIVYPPVDNRVSILCGHLYMLCAFLLECWNYDLGN